MIRPEDMAHCRAAIRTGSLSFHAASRLLPGRVRDPALALYAFCRLADDEVDEGGDEIGAVLRLGERLDLAYRGRPENAPEDRAFAALVEAFEMPRALPEALLEGLAWDAEGRRYADLSGLRDYSARVAAAVGAMMCVLMGVRDARVLARACDLGVAMQLTNIARDVGEDARNGRVYLPLDWLAEAGLAADDVIGARSASPALRQIVERLLAEAHGLYRRSEAGIAGLPLSARPGIFAARLIYAAIGAEISASGHDSVTRRARTSRGRKLALIGVAASRAALTVVAPVRSDLDAPPLGEVQFLVDAAARAVPQGGWGQGRTGAVLSLLADLEARDRALVSRPHGTR